MIRAIAARFDREPGRDADRPLRVRQVDPRERAGRRAGAVADRAPAADDGAPAALRRRRRRGGAPGRARAPTRSRSCPRGRRCPRGCAWSTPRTPTAWRSSDTSPRWSAPSRTRMSWCACSTARTPSAGITPIFSRRSCGASTASPWWPCSTSATAWTRPSSRSGSSRTFGPTSRAAGSGRSTASCAPPPAGMCRTRAGTRRPARGTGSTSSTSCGRWSSGSPAAGGWSTGGWRTPGSCTGSCWRRPRASSPPTGRRPGPGWRRSKQAQAQAFEAAVGALRDSDPRRGGGWGAAFYQSLATRWVGPVGWMLAFWTRATTLGSGLGTLLRWARPSGAERAKGGADGGVSRAGLEPALRGYRAAFLSAWPAVSERLVQARFAPVVRGVDPPLDAAESDHRAAGRAVGRGRAARNRACGPPAGRDRAAASAQRPGGRGFGDRGVDDGAEVLHRRLPAGRLLHARLLGRRHHPAPELLRAATGRSSGRLRTGHRPGVCSRAAGDAGGGRRGPAPAEVAAASAARPGGGGTEG